MTEELSVRASDSSRKVVVVHSGRRDHYQAARALSESGRLEALVTDLYSKPRSIAASLIDLLAPASIAGPFRSRREDHLSSGQVKTCSLSGALTLALDKWAGAPFAWRRALMRATDARLGAVAGRHASRTDAALLSYSYYGHSAFSHYRGTGPRLLFQLHPHPASMRQILRAELEQHPDCASSLKLEWELALSEADYQHLVEETRMPDGWLAASTFTKHTLVENGIDAAKIHVTPYGVDLDRFRPGDPANSLEAPLQLLFVGRINQRKGVKYLLEALECFPAGRVELLICGRVVDDLKLFERFGRRVTIRPSVGDEELIAAYQSSDLFVFPSVAEGFGHVLLEAMACGLPVLSTTATAAPDIVDDGVDGFVVHPRSVPQLADRIDWALSHRFELRRMRALARRKAERFTWQRFRAAVVTAVDQYCGAPAHASAFASDYEAVR